MAREQNTVPTSLKKAAERSTRQSAGRAAVFLVIAVGAAVGSVVLVMQYLDTQAGGSRALTTPVAVAAIDLPLSTTLTTDALTTVEWPKEMVPAGAFQDPAELVGRVVITKIFKGELVTANRIAQVGAGVGLAAVLPKGYLAVSVHVDDVVGVAGFVHPGDNVDVIVTMQPRPNDDVVSKFILYNIPVLAVGKQIERAEGSQTRRPISATVATLMVTAEEAERLALASSRGQLLLALRSSLDDSITETKGIIPSLLLAGFKRPAPVSTPREQPSSKQGETVEIMRGDQLEQRVFEDRQP